MTAFDGVITTSTADYFANLSDEEGCRLGLSSTSRRHARTYKRCRCLALMSGLPGRSRVPPRGIRCFRPATSDCAAVR